MKIAVEANYSLSESKVIELPENKTVEDIIDIWVKWDTVHIQFKGINKLFEYDLNTWDNDYDFKRPNNINIYSVNDDDEIDFNTELFGDLK